MVQTYGPAEPGGRRRPCGRDGWLVRAAVLALGRGSRQVGGQAGRAGLHRRRIAEHRGPAAGRDHLVRHDNHEVHDGHEDNEVDHRGDERADVQERRRVARRTELPAEPDRVLAFGAGDQRIDDTGCEGTDQRAECQRHDQAHRNDDHVAAQQEIAEASHACSPFCTAGGLHLAAVNSKPPDCHIGPFRLCRNGPFSGRVWHDPGQAAGREGGVDGRS